MAGRGTRRCDTEGGLLRSVRAWHHNDTAAHRDWILLFDEADTLLGKRCEVKDGHDRYANIEVSYLLLRMEAYRGLAVL